MVAEVDEARLSFVRSLFAEMGFEDQDLTRRINTHRESQAPQSLQEGVLSTTANQFTRLTKSSDGH